MAAECPKDGAYHPIYIIPGQVEPCVYATEVMGRCCPLGLWASLKDDLSLSKEARKKEGKYWNYAKWNLTVPWSLFS